MAKKRLIARIDVKNEYAIKGIQLEGLRKVGNPNDLSQRYYRNGIDEILFMDAVASLYGRSNLFEIIRLAAREVFVPITLGGGIRLVDDIEAALHSGADKVTLNTQAIRTPDFISEASKIFGSQCILGSIEAKRKGGSWEAYCDTGRNETGLDAIEWAKRLEGLGVGEIIVTSIDQEGTKKGFDIPLVKAICDAVSVPVIACGGAGTPAHILDLFQKTTVDAVAIASILHYNLFSIEALKSFLLLQNIQVRV